MRVPTYDAPTVGATTLPQPNFSPATFSTAQPATLRPIEAREARGINTPDIAGKQLQQTGDQLQRVGQQMANMQIEAEREVMQLRVDDALNRAKEAALRLTHDKEVGFVNLKGLNALERPDGKALEDEYGETLKKEIDGIGESLGTDAQKQMFAQRARELEMGFRTNVSRHSSSEFQTYTLSVAEGVQATALDEIGKNYNNPEVVVGAVDRIKAQVYRQAKMLGKSAEWQEAQVRKVVSGAHKVALSAALEDGDPEYANGYMAKFSKEMEADDLLQVRGAITKEMNTRAGLTVAAEVIQKVAPVVDPGPAERAFNVQGVDMGKAFGALIVAESGGRQFGRDGQPLTSSAGAIGIAQVMPKTGPEAAKLAGMPWDENRYRNDAEYNKALGLAYFQKQLQDQGGDLAKAYAAYNAGPGRLREAVTKSKKEGGNWIDHVPAETQAYVAKNMAAYEKGGGAPKAPTFDDIDRALRADPRLSNPEVYKVARIDAERQFNGMVKAKKQREEEATNSALQAVIDNGGDFAALPQAVRNNIPPDQMGKVMDLAAKLSKGEEIKTDPNQYYGLTIMAADDPKTFTGLDLRPYFDKLSPADRKHFMDLQAAAGKPDKQAEIASTTQQKNYVADALGLKDEKKGIFMQQADAALLAAQKENGKPLTQDQRQKVLDQLVIKGEITGRWRDGFAFEARAEGRNFKPEFSDTDRRKAIAALQRAGNSQPTQAEIDATIRRAYGIAPKAGGATGSF